MRQVDPTPPPPRPPRPRPGAPLTEFDMGQALRQLRHDWAGLTIEALAAKHRALSKSTISARELTSQGHASSAFIDAFVTSCLRHRGMPSAGIITELGHWQEARSDILRQRHSPPAPAPPPPPTGEDDPAAAPPAATETTPAVRPDSGDVSPASHIDVASPQRRSRRPRWVWWVTLAAAVIVVGVVSVVWLTGGSVPSATDRAAPGTARPAQPLVVSPPFVPGRTYSQVVNTLLGARTYKDPSGLVGEGPRINNRMSVRVSCKIVAPGENSIGTYWYRIVDQPWNDLYYAPTNSFLNDDPISGSHDKAVDEAVPYCP